MQIKKLARILVLNVAFVALAACSAHHRTDEASVDNANGMNYNSGAETSGVNDASNWGADNASAHARKGDGRTYYFDFDRSDVRDSDKPSVFANANYLVSHPHARVIVEGYTDPRGSREYNVALGERRARAVADLLKSHGANSRQVRILSYGAERLASPGRTETDYQLDRRAIIVYTQK